ncbi:MAG: AI-2E family transporter [Salegentibacter sp.]
MAEKNDSSHEYSFVKKVWITGGIFALLAVILLLIRATFNVFLLILAGTLIACYFRGLSSFIAKKTNWNNKLTMAIAVVGSILLLAGIGWLIGSKVQAQIAQLSESLPAAFHDAKDYLDQSWLGQQLVEKVEDAKSGGKMASFFTTFFRTTFGILGDLYLILFIGIYFTVSPSLYKKGIIKIVPPRGRDKAKEVLSHLGSGLQKWLAGKIFAMFVVFVLTSIGLISLGMPMWLALALIAGFLNFVPNFGPLIAMIPAVLLALSQDPTMALLVVGLYLLVQLLESNFITPMVQQRLIQIPPALIIISQILVGALTGMWGIVLATPLVLIVMIVVEDLYTKPMKKQKEQ